MSDGHSTKIYRDITGHVVGVERKGVWVDFRTGVKRKSDVGWTTDEKLYRYRCASCGCVNYTHVRIDVPTQIKCWRCFAVGTITESKQ